MFKFEFSNKLIVSRNTSSYPISLSTIKAKSFYFIENPSDTTQDSFISNVIIPNIVYTWEKNTSYLLLDQTIKAFVPDLSAILSPTLEISLDALNIREVDYVKYYPSDWAGVEAKTTLDEEDEYMITQELLGIPPKLRIKQDALPLNLFEITNNLEAQYKAGFQGNVFTGLNQEIVDCLSMQAAIAIDVKNGYCEDYYSGIIKELYSKYAVEKQLISII